MAIRIFVTATNTGIGKTYTILRLMERAAEKGARPAAFKPIETGVMGNRPADGTLLFETMKRVNPSTKSLRLEEIVPCQFELPAAPYVAKKEKVISLERIEERLKKVEAHCDILFIEGAGGLMVPIDEKIFMIDLPERFAARTLLISPSRLGSINDTLLSMEALHNRDMAFDLMINLHEERDDFEKVTYPYYLKQGIDHYLFPEDIDRYLGNFIFI